PKSSTCATPNLSSPLSPAHPPTSGTTLFPMTAIFQLPAPSFNLLARWMKHFFLACLFPALLTAQNMQLTEQLGKTVLYGDIALSPDGKNVAWVQSTAATTTKQTYIRGTSPDATAALVNLGVASERTDADPAW